MSKKINLIYSNALKTMVFNDQREIFLGHRKSSIFKNNLLNLKKLISKFGFPIISLVGKKGSENAWIIVQHSDHDVKFQSQYLKEFRKKVEVGEGLKKNLAYLEDRVLINTKKKQKYGTQLFDYKDPERILSTIIDPNNVDKRRRLMGLGSFEEYMKLAKRMGKLKNNIPPKTNDSCPCNSGKIWKHCHGK